MRLTFRLIVIILVFVLLPALLFTIISYNIASNNQTSFDRIQKEYQFFAINTLKNKLNISTESWDSFSNQQTSAFGAQISGELDKLIEEIPAFASFFNNKRFGLLDFTNGPESLNVFQFLREGLDRNSAENLNAIFFQSLIDLYFYIENSQTDMNTTDIVRMHVADFTFIASPAFQDSNNSIYFLSIESETQSNRLFYQVFPWFFPLFLLSLIVIMLLALQKIVFQPIRKLELLIGEINALVKGNRPYKIISRRKLDLETLYDDLIQFNNQLLTMMKENQLQKEQIISYSEDLEDRVRERTAELESARLRAEVANVQKSKFLVNMNHELRTPLNSINGIIDLLRFGAYDRNEELSEVLNDIAKEISGMESNSLDSKTELVSLLEKSTMYLKDDGNLYRFFVNLIEDWARSTSTDEVFRSELILEFKAQIEDQERNYFKALNSIREAGESLLSLINEVINLSRVESGQIELNRTVQKVSEIVNYVLVHSNSYLSVKKKSDTIVLEKQIGSSVPEDVVVDGQKIKQVLFNLMTNAIKYSDEGTVKLKVSYHGQWLLFEVEDQGIGISENDWPLIFSEFGRTFNARDIEGTGLGLALSKKLVETHKGEIGFQSKEKEGSTFWFTIPLDQEE